MFSKLFLNDYQCLYIVYTQLCVCVGFIDKMNQKG